MQQKKFKNISPRIKVIQRIYHSLMNPGAEIEFPKNQYKKFIKDVVTGTLERSELIEDTISEHIGKDIELKKTEDSFASAANYLRSIGWKKNQPCFYRVNLKENVPKKYLSSSARKIKFKKNFSYFQKYIKNTDTLEIKKNKKMAIIIPDKDIIPGAETLSPAFIVFENYEKILQWNRSLRFALAVCTLKDYFINEI